MHQCLILTPTWKSQLELSEYERIKISILNNKDYPHAFMGPEGLDYSFYKRNFPDSEIHVFDQRYFKSVPGYNELLLSSSFYRYFEDLSVCMLICQLDALLVKTLTEDIVLKYDYLGASWEKPYPVIRMLGRYYFNHPLLNFLARESVIVGNGGLSIRNVAQCASLLQTLELTSGMKSFRMKNGLFWNEDLVLSYLMLVNGKRLPNKEEADEIFLEHAATNLMSWNSVYGFHAIDKINPGLERMIFVSHEEQIGEMK